MLDLSTEKGRVVAAAMRLAATRPWSEVAIRDIAAEAGISLADLRRSFGSKTQIVAGYMRAVDDAVLNSATFGGAETSPRDRLFEVLMARFDAMAEHKPALKSIAGALAPDSTLIKALFNSQRWMLMAAGIDGDGPSGIVRTGGLASVYASVFRIWLADDDPGLAHTMAALDRRLRRGESAVSAMEQACQTLGRLGSLLKPAPRRPRASTPPENEAFGGATGGVDG